MRFAGCDIKRHLDRVAFFVTNLCAVRGLSSLHHASGEHTLYKTAVGVGMHFERREVLKGRESMNVINMPTGDLIPYENNTKIHPPEQVEHIANSIKRFGWQQPIVIDKNNVVIIGHGRLLAAKQMGLQEVPVVYADDLSEEDAQALRLADNKLNESPWDFGKLEEELAQLAIDGIDMSEFGFDVDIGGGQSHTRQP